MARNLHAPPSYWVLTAEQKASICNGAGPRGKGWMVPDTMYCLSVTEACNIHDYEYHVGTAEADRFAADLNLLCNLAITILNAGAGVVLNRLRMARAVKYFLAVRYHGASAFDAGKHLPE